MIKLNPFLWALFSLLFAGILWFFLFVVKPMNFWLEMSLSLAALVFFALVVQRDLFSLGRLTLRHLAVGVLSFLLLYLIFYVGNIVTGYILPFKNTQVSMVYSNRAQAAPWLIGVLLLLVIAPGEEFFWRGFIQRQFSEKFGAQWGWILGALAYGGVHLITGNAMLVIAALVCGFYWGFLYKNEKSLWPVLISHALWDFTIFVLFPLK